MVEWTALEMRRTLTGTLGSNPSLSAKKATERPAKPFNLAENEDCGQSSFLFLRQEKDCQSQPAVQSF